MNVLAIKQLSFIKQRPMKPVKTDPRSPPEASSGHYFVVSDQLQADL